MVKMVNFLLYCRKFIESYQNYESRHSTSVAAQKI